MKMKINSTDFRKPQPQQRMGCNFLLNMADQCFSVAGYDKDVAKVGTLRQESKECDVAGASDIKEFIGLLHQPRNEVKVISYSMERDFKSK
jgi:6-phosphogluconate dehydrogenase